MGHVHSDSALTDKRRLKHQYEGVSNTRLQCGGTVSQINIGSL